MTKPFRVRYVSDLDPASITHRICFNPNYGGPSTSVPGTCQVKIRRAVKPKTRERIKASIAREGFRNPILVYNTPEGIFLGFGGGRLQAAQELSIPVPAIVVDYVGSYYDSPLVTPRNWQEYFTDVPTLFTFTDVGIDTHYSLERTRHGEADPAGMEWASDEDMQAVLDESPWLDDGTV